MATGRAKKITELTAATSVAAADLIPVVTDVANTAATATKKVTVGTLFGNIPGDAVANTVGMRYTASPANGSVTVISAGKMFFDADYLYIAVANNVVKRIALSSF